MGINIIPYPKELEPAVQRFNQRLESGGKGEYVFPENCTSRMFPRDAGRSVWREYFVAKDENEEVRGGYIMRGQPFWLRGQEFEMPFLKLPVSEGSVNTEYAYLALSLLMDVNERNPQHFAMGMGGLKNRLPKIMRKMGNTVEEIPFYFRIERPSRVLRTLPMLHKGSRLRSVASSVAGVSGIGCRRIGGWKGALRE